MFKARLAPALLVTLSLLMQGCIFDDDNNSLSAQEKTDSLISEAEKSGGSAVVVNEAGVASLTDEETGLTISVNASAVTGLAEGDSFVLQVIPLTEDDIPDAATTIEIAGEVFNIKIRSVKNGTELQPTGGMQVTLPFGSSINSEDIQTLAIANYHEGEWVLFAADAVDETNKTVTATITQLSPVTVVKNLAANSAPVAPDYTGTIYEDGIYGVKINATDADGDTLTYSWLDGTTGGKPAYSAGLDAEGNFNYQPPANYNGQTGLTYKVTDGQLSSTGTITITVLPVNDAPVANSSEFSAEGNLGSQGEFSANDVDGTDVLTYTLVTQPEHGTVIISGNTYTYTPDANYDGEDSFEYTVSDGTTTSSSAGTVTITVTPLYRYVLEDGSGDGTSWNSATSSVQDAIDDLVALGGGRVLIGPGTFYANSDNTPVASIPQNAKVDLYGGFNGNNIAFAQRPEVDPTTTILSGDTDQDGEFSDADADNVVYTYGGLIDGLTITGGNGSRGAGVFVYGIENLSPAVLNQVVVRNNQADDLGGGIIVRNDSGTSELTITNSSITDNTAVKGGGIYTASATVRIEDSEVLRNSVTDLGGGIYAGANLTMERTIVRENTLHDSPQSWAGGGGIYVAHQATLNLTDVEIDANTSEWGGGIYMAGKSALNVQGSSISYNEASGAGAIYNEYARMEIAGSHINHNQSEYAGGGIYNSFETEEDVSTGDDGSGDSSSDDTEGLYDQCDSESYGSDQYIALDCDTVYETYDTCNELDLYLEADVATFTELGCASIDPDEWEIPDIYQSCPLDYATLVLTDSEMVGNISAGSGGALYEKGQSCITNVSFVNNQAFRGGAIEAAGSDTSTIEITNSTFVGNQAIGNDTNSSGGAIWAQGYYVTSILRNVSFVNNSAQAEGGAVYLWSNVTSRISNFSFFGNTAPTGQDFYVGGASSSFNYVNIGLGYGCAEQDIPAYASSGNLYSYGGDFASNVSVATGSPLVLAASGEVFFDQANDCANAGDADTATAAFNSLEAWSGLTSDMENSTTQEASGLVAAGNLNDPADVWIKTFSASASAISFTSNQTEPSCDLYANDELIAEDVLSGDAHNQSNGTVLTLTCASAVSHAKSARATVQ